MSFAKSRRGVKFGAKRKMTPERIAEAKAMLEAGKSAREIAKHFGVAVSSIYGNKITAERTAMNRDRKIRPGRALDA
jgi:transposase